MFTLRIVSTESGTQNINLGDSYSVLSKADNPKAFNDMCDEKDSRYKTARTIVVSHSMVRDYPIKHYPIQDGEKDKPLKYYIVTENGNTFEKL